MSEELKISELFFPYYINQGRLLDVYAILNKGYSEYSELTTAVSDEKSKTGKGEINANGFKLFNFGSSISGEIGKTDSHTTENKEKKVQTVTSVLSIVLSELEKKKFIHKIGESKEGEFVLLPVVLSINSIKAVMTELSDILKLAGDMEKFGAKVNSSNNSINYDTMLKSIKVLFDGEEIIYETDDFAVTGNISEKNLYQAVRDDIIGTKLNCLAQVKRVFPNGTELMRNTTFSKIKDNKAKQQFADSIKQITGTGIYEFESVVVFSIKDKPVYQLEIIALYQ